MRLLVVPFEPFLLLNLEMKFCFRGRVVTPRVSNPYDYVNHMFNRP
jgi:hypothetical protein